MKVIRIFIALSLLTGFSIAGKRVSSLNIGAEAGWHPAIEGNGVLMFSLKGLRDKGGYYYFLYNTDTLMLAMGDLPLGSWTWEFHLKGQAIFSRSLFNYYKKGKRRPGYAFGASHTEGRLGIKRALKNGKYFNLAVTPRYWWFSSMGGTAAEYALPADSPEIESSAELLWWRFREFDGEDSRPFPSFKGWGFSLKAVHAYRFQNNSFGAPEFGANRNKGENHFFALYQWWKWGKELGGFRFQYDEQRAMIWYGADDVNRTALGGLNPYTGYLAGLAWGAQREQFFYNSRTKIIWPLGNINVWYFLFDAYVGLDPDREGNIYRQSGAIGMGAGLDLRAGDWQIDLVAGWAPPLKHFEEKLQAGFWVSMGRSWEK